MANAKKVSSDMAELQSLQAAISVVDGIPVKKINPVIMWNISRNAGVSKKAQKVAAQIIRVALPPEQFKAMVIAELQAEIDKIKARYPGVVD